MRALQVVGITGDGKTVICEDPAGNERFQLPADERLRAAARGDITRLGQIEIELESQMRPREIQTRIRAGESVEQVANAAGMPAEKVERFAYPVLLERSRTAELAQRAHPIREDGPDVRTLGEVAQTAFGARGQDYAVANWDSWKGEDGKWVVQLSWTAGRSYNRAHWAFHPGAHGGTVTPLDDHAVDLLDPNPTRPLRTVRAVTELAQQALERAPQPVAQPVAQRAQQAVNGDEVSRQDYTEDFELSPDLVEELSPEELAPPVELVAPMVDEDEFEVEEPTEIIEPIAPVVPVRVEPAAEVAPEPVEQPEAPSAPAPKPAPARRAKSKKGRPIVPSWEDVLLGTRSNRG